ncbi:RHS repeat-associated core domain-containing protein [Streptomyces sp. YIM 98790]|uniref:RHS repeat-associated core domain-containing protein n=1 Tax=Streptomyces sp. YIM 98790 TaxID=2689077 RepID=UPI00140C6DE2|nr:RHS repeat-associated core domain-containing protein [Streptomyces sp. YIM 98790]
MAALDCIPAFKGLTTAAGLAAGLRNLGRNFRNLAGDGLSAARRNPPPHGKPPGGRCRNGDPVDMVSGEMLIEERDVELPAVLPLTVRRTHLSSYRYGRFFGTSWASTLDERLEMDEDGAVFATEDGMLLLYPVPLPDRAVLPVNGPAWPLAWDGTPYGEIRVTDPRTGCTRHFAPLGRHPAGTRRYTLYLTEISDRNGNFITFDRQADGAPLAIRHSGGYRIDVDLRDDRISGLRLADPNGPPGGVRLLGYGYTVAGDLERIYNSSGLPKVFTYDERARITSWTDRNEAWYRFTYDAQDRCVAGDGVDGILSCRIAYDTDARTTRFTNALGHTTVYRWNDRLQLTSVTSPLGHTLRQEWDERDRLVAQTNELGHTTRLSYDTEGNLTALERPDGARLVAEHNRLGRPVLIREPDGAEWRHRYDAAGNRVATIDPLGHATRYEYGDHGELLAVRDPLGHTSRTETDRAGLPLRITDPLGRTVTVTRDAFGRAVAITNAMGETRRFGWTTEGRAAWEEGPDRARQTWEWDGEANLLRHVTAAGLAYTAEYRWSGLPVRRTDPDGTAYRFRYDGQLNLLSVTTGGGEEQQDWSYRYDAANRVVQETDYAGRTVDYVLDAAGRVHAVRAGDHTPMVLTRDALGRVTERRSGDWTVTHEYDAAGNEVRATGPHATVQRTFDPLGRVLSESVNGRETTWRYDPLGRRVERRTPSGAISAWEYDGAGRPRTLGVAGRLLEFGYDEADREVSRTFGHGLALVQSWDPANRLIAQSVEHRRGEDTHLVQRREYRYRADGLATEIGELTTGVRRFELDRGGRVTSVQAPGRAESYVYDTTGNLTLAVSSRGPGERVESRQEYLGNRLRRAGHTTYDYDGFGRPVRSVKRLLNGQRRITTYEWDADSRLTAVRTPDGEHWAYEYDPVGRRIAKQRLTGDGTPDMRIVFTWDGHRLAEQVTDSGHVTSWDYAPGTHRPLTQLDRGPAQAEVDARFHAIVTDLTGAPAELIAPDGTIAWHLRTTLWGMPLTGGGSGDGPGGDGPVDCPLRFAGQYADPETGWHYNFHRYYDPATARFVTPDPLGLDAAPNHYSYGPNPLWWLDPLGLYRNPANGQYAHDPNAPPTTHNRDTEYPGGYRQSTHDEMAIRWTDEGRTTGAVPRDPRTGERIPRSDLTWRDRYGNIIPSDQLTYEHREPVVDHWNREGYNSDRATRNDWYNRVDNLEPMTRSQNSSGGAQMTARYRQDVGPNYSCS